LIYLDETPRIITDVPNSLAVFFIDKWHYM